MATKDVLILHYNGVYILKKIQERCAAIAPRTIAEFERRQDGGQLPPLPLSLYSVHTCVVHGAGGRGVRTTGLCCAGEHGGRKGSDACPPGTGMMALPYFF